MTKRFSLVKRCFDITGAATATALLAPAGAAAVLLVKAGSPGPAFFVHDRLGSHGRPIRIYKFRSMKEGAEELEKQLTDEELEKYYREYKLERDPRVTKAGRFLRMTYMDELPQLINVLQSRLSLVGPRPVTSDELCFYSDAERELLLSVKPGITGLWQVFGKGRATYQNGKRQQMELFYAEHASLLLDAAILLATPAAVLSGLRSFGSR